MRFKLLLLIVAISACLPTMKVAGQVNDTIYSPNVIYSSMPRSYEIAGIKVTGVDNYEDYIIIGYSGLTVGQKVEIPGDEITSAAKRFWRQGLFSKVQIKVDKIYGDKVWLEIALRQQPRIAEINYNGVKKGEREDLQLRLGLMKGNQFTPNIAARAEQIIDQYFDSKGFKNADVDVIQRPLPDNENEVIVDINVDKHEKIKVHKIYIEGNEVLSDRKLKRVMKKTNEKGMLIKLFSQKKFVTSDYEDDKKRIIEKYNELGYRDAKIIAERIRNGRMGTKYPNRTSLCT